jgi:uncharacterized protein
LIGSAGDSRASRPRDGWLFDYPRDSECDSRNSAGVDGEGVKDVESDMTQPAKAQEPSMEEILASIRRIIADDDPKSASPATAEPVAMAEPPRAATPPKIEPVRTEMPRNDVPRNDLRNEPSRDAARRSLADLPPARSESSRTEARQAPSPMSATPAPPNSTQQEMDAMLANLDDEIVATPPLKPAATDVLELTESMVSPSILAKTNAFRTIEPQNDVEFSELADTPAAEPIAPPAPRPPPAAKEQAREAIREPVRTTAPSPAPEAVQETDAAPQPALLSGSTIAAVDSAFNSLAHTVFAQNARTLEDLVKEMLRPMLKNWLDDNLPEVVERIVRAEIERVSRGR